MRKGGDVQKGLKKKIKETYCTSVNIIALGTISIIVRLTILKYELIRSSF